MPTTRLDEIVYEAAAKEAILVAVAIVLADATTGEVVYASRAMEAMFGYPPRGLVGVCVDELLPPDLRAAHAKYRALFAESPRARPMGTGMVLRGVHADGSEFPIQVGLVPLSFDVMGRRLVAATVLDLTEPVKTVSMIQQQLSESGAVPVLKPSGH